MTHREFCIWLQGYLELCGVSPHVADLSSAQTRFLKKRLDDVMGTARPALVLPYSREERAS